MKNKKTNTSQANRLEILLFNAITLLEQEGYCEEKLIEELGITKQEYDKILQTSYQ